MLQAKNAAQPEPERVGCPMEKVFAGALNNQMISQLQVLALCVSLAAIVVLPAPEAAEVEGWGLQ